MPSADIITFPLAVHPMAMPADPTGSPEGRRGYCKAIIEVNEAITAAITLSTEPAAIEALHDLRLVIVHGLGAKVLGMGGESGGAA